MTIMNRICDTNGLWEIRWYDNIQKIQYREKDNFFFIPIKNITKNSLDGFVVNFTTNGEGDSNHTYLAGNSLMRNCDGKIWHEKEGQKEKEAERDQKLASIGWRVLRFNEDAINESMDQVTKVIYQNIQEAADDIAKRRKKASTSEQQIKCASTAYYRHGDNIHHDDAHDESGVIQITLGVNDDSIQS